VRRLNFLKEEGRVEKKSFGRGRPEKIPQRGKEGESIKCLERSRQENCKNPGLSKRKKEEEGVMAWERGGGCIRGLVRLKKNLHGEGEIMGKTAL